MKNLLFFKAALLLFLSLTIFEAKAGYIDAKSASELANNHLNYLGKLKDYSIHTYREIYGEDKARPLYYVFNLTPQGFIIISGNSDISPVIGYAFENNYFASKGKPGDDPSSAILWLTEARNKYNNKCSSMRDIRKGSKDRSLDDEDLKQWPEEGKTPTGGWLKENWGQGAPYNNYCPKEPEAEVRSSSGGPAIAMAQILNYYKCINNTRFSKSDSYINEKGSEYAYSFDYDYEIFQFPSFNQLNGYLETLENKFEKGVAIGDADKAALVFACGLKIKQYYGKEDINCLISAEQAYDAYNKFSCVHTEHYNSFYKKIFIDLEECMKKANPAHIVFRNKDNAKGCHAVIDGYNTDGFYHINFGKDGLMNGWYQLQYNMPEDYAIVQGAMLNINQAPNEVFEPANGLGSSYISVYPNPFNEAVTIRIDDKAGAAASLAIYDLTGAMVRNFNADVLYPGAILYWDGTDNSGKSLGIGSYIIKITTKGGDTYYDKIIISY